MTVAPQFLSLLGSFLCLAMARHGFGAGLPWSAGGIAFLALAALQGRSARTAYVYAPWVGVGVLALAVSTIANSGSFPNMLNSVFILLSFPLVAMATSRQANPRLLKAILAIIVVLTLLGVASGRISIDYLGDDRGARWMLGWTKPTFCSEAMALGIIVAACLARFGEWRYRTAILVIAVLGYVLLKTGSRAALGAAVLTLLLMVESALPTWTRFWAKATLRGGALLLALYIAANPFGGDVLNDVSSGRWLMMVLEVRSNLPTTSHWLWGNLGAEHRIHYFDDLGSVYHVDSFFGERLIVAGLIGLGLVVAMVARFHLSCGPTGRAILVGTVFYALFENAAFNFTSFFALFTLVVARIATLLERDARLARRAAPPAPSADLPALAPA